jgi:hypothetical protein
VTPLEILRRSFRPISLPRPGELITGVYLLVGDGEIFYCGGSQTNVFIRIASHLNEYEIDEALWYPLPAALVFDYEGAFTRFLNPSENAVTSRYRGYDNEILGGFGLPPHVDQDAVARVWHLKRYGKMMVPQTEEQKAWRRKLRARGSETVQ